MKRCVILLAITAMVCGCARLPEVKPITAGGIKKDGGIFYALPKTVITGSVTRNKFAEKENGCFKYFKGVHPKLNKWNFVDESIESTYVPDLNHIYYVDLFKSGLNNIVFSASYNSKNFITKSTVKTENMAYDVAVSALSGLLKVAKAAVLGGASTTEYTLKSGDDKKVETLLLKRTYTHNECSDLYKDYHAVMMAKINMVSSLQSESKDLIKYRMELLNVMESAYLRPFFEVYSDSVQFAIVPTEDSQKETCYHVADFIYNGVSGMWKSSTLQEQGKIDCNNVPSNSLYVRLVRDTNEFSAKFKDIPFGDDRHSYYYRIPGRAKVTLYFKGLEKEEVLMAKTLTVNQFGTISAIALKPGGKQAAADIEFDEATGAIKAISMESQIIDPAKLQAIPDAISDVVKAAYDQELLELQRRRAILEEKAAIADFEKRNATGQ